MEKKIENSKPILNRTRRQLILGAGLTPVVMTLHAAKVMAKTYGDPNPSGAAPYSAVIRGSEGLAGLEGTEDTEFDLYQTLCSSGTSEKVTKYYGTVGSAPSFDSEYSLTSSILSSWTTDPWKVTETADPPRLWVTSYEKRFSTPIHTYMTTSLPDTTLTVAQGLAALFAVTSKADVTEATKKIYSAFTSVTLGTPAGITSSKISSYSSYGVIKYYSKIADNKESILSKYEGYQEAATSPSAALFEEEMED